MYVCVAGPIKEEGCQIVFHENEIGLDLLMCVVGFFYLPRESVLCAVLKKEPYCSFFSWRIKDLKKPQAQVFAKDMHQLKSCWKSVSSQRNCLPEPLLDEEHELLLAFVGHFHVFYQLAELHQSVVGQQERLAGFSQKVDKVAVMAWANVRQSRVCRIDVGRNSRIQQRF